MEEILDYIEETFPAPALLPNNPLAEAATEDFFSKFCFYIKVSGYTVGTVGIPYVKLKISRGNFFYSDMAE